MQALGIGKQMGPGLSLAKKVLRVRYLNGLKSSTENTMMMKYYCLLMV